MPHGRGGEGSGRGGGDYLPCCVCYFSGAKTLFSLFPTAKRRLIRMSGRSLPFPPLPFNEFLIGVYRGNE